MKLIKKTLKNEKGASLIEYVLVMASIGLIVSLLSPWFQEFMSGSPDSTAPGDAGFVNQAMETQTAGLSESVDSVELIPGCDTTIVDSCP